MNEREIIVYFYCGKKNKEELEILQRVRKANQEKRKLYHKLLNWYVLRCSESYRRSCIRELTQDKECPIQSNYKLELRERDCYGISYISCRLPFSLELLSMWMEKGQGEETVTCCVQECLRQISGREQEKESAGKEYYVNYEPKLLSKLERLSELQKLIKQQKIHEQRKQSNTAINLANLQDVSEYGTYQRGMSPSFIINYYKHNVKKGILIIIDGEGAEAFLYQIYEDLNHLVVITSNPENWESFMEKAYEESGLMVQVLQSTVHDDGCNSLLQNSIWYHGYLFDFSEKYEETGISVRSLPKGLTYLDLHPTMEKQHLIEGKRKDIAYMPCPKCLDTC